MTPEQSLRQDSDAHPELQQRVLEEQFALIFTGTNRNSSFIAFAMCVVLWVYVNFVAGNPWALAWGLLVHATQLARSFWVGRYFRDRSATVADRAWVRGYIWRLGLSGAAWGSAPLFMFDSADVATVTLITVTLLAMHSGGQTWVTPVPRAMLAFCVPIIVGLCLAFVLHDNPAYRVAGVLALIYLGLSVRFSLQHGAILQRWLYARLQNERLNAELSRKIHAAEHSSSEKSRFLAAASHDLRQPMHAIALFSASLENNLRGTPHHENAQRSLEAVKALSESLDAMLDVSKLDAGVVPVDEAPVTLQHMFQRLNAVLLPQAAEKGLHLRFRSTPLQLRTDGRHLERMLANLVSNAIRYTPAGGVLVAARRRAQGAVIEVWDTGVGIPAEQTDRIFEEFYQLGNPERDRSQGLGIGLAVVRRLSQLLGAPVTLRSRVGRGSVFRITFDAPQVLADVPPRSSEPAPAQPAAGAGALPRCVLVLDDEADILVAVRSMLHSHGVQVLTAATREDALTQLQAQRDGVDVLICDLRLGGGTSGLDFAQALGPLHGIRIPTLIVTGETGPEALQRVRASGLPTLFKPVAAQRLLEALRELNAAPAAPPDRPPTA